MFGSDRELNWLEEYKERAIQAETWDAFCDSIPMGNHYRKYGWLQRHWEFLHERGFLMCRPVKYPKVRRLDELIAEARLSEKSPGGGWVYFDDGHGSETISGSYGGKRGWSKVSGPPDWKPIRAHYGGKFYHVYVRVRPEIQVTQFFDTGKSSLQAIRHENGKVLIVAKSPRIIAEDWIAYLDSANGLEGMLPEADREFLARERAAEKEAWGK